jgi:ectoine hydroxylase-related dioxygenase (phytanoyl-CoA dioxygenase family)
MASGGCQTDEWFSAIAAGSSLPLDALRDLCDAGFVVIPGPVASDGMARLADAYDSAAAGASVADVRVGSTTTRVTDLVNRGPDFDALYVFAPILEAAGRVIDRPFRLSTMHARTVRPHAPAQDLHVDFPGESDGWPMLGFILMVDAFRSDNGATRFVPRSQHEPQAEREVLACGPAGSLILFNGSVRHSHSANSSAEPRRSIQGAYIRRNAASGIDLPGRMRADTLARITPLAKYVLAI